jgi:Flp pilus assembly protein TadD
MPIATPEERTRAYKLKFVPVQRMLDAGQFPDALTELERVVADSPDCAEAHNDLAVLYHAAGRLPEADRESRRALEIDPFHADIRENRAAIAAALGAAATAPAAAAGGPAPTPAPTAAASAPISLRAGAPAPRTEGAAPNYRQVLRNAESMLASGQLDAAVAEIERFVEAEPATAEAWNDLGVLHRNGGRPGPARAALIVALTIEPMNRQAGYNLTRVLLELGNHNEALRTLEPFLTRDPRDTEALTLAGDISLALGQGGDAGAFYRSALALDPSNVEIAVKLATAAAAPPAGYARAAEPAAAPAVSSFLATPAVSFPPSAATPLVLGETLRALEYDPRIRLVTPAETYDTVTCKTPLDRLPNPLAALAEMTRLLKPGGRLWIDLDGPLEVIKHGVPSAPAEGAIIDLLPAFRAR